MPMPAQPGPKAARRFRIFAPILAGATLRDRAIACLGALIGIGLTSLLFNRFSGGGAHLSLTVAAPIGASAVLLFAVPASPMAQPWAIIGGNTISALVGVIVVHFVHDQVIAAGLAVGLAIGAMSLTRCLHPPGGASALTAVLGGPAVATYGLLFPFIPVALNSIVLVAIGAGFHWLTRRSYPHVPAPAPVNTHRTLDPAPPLRAGFRMEDIDAALATMHETFDIDRGDLDQLLRQVELQALLRSHGALSAADIMSRDIIRVGLEDRALHAHDLLLVHNIRTLPVVDAAGKLVGAVGLREVSNVDDRVGSLMSDAATAAPDDPALALVPVLTDGRTHAVIIVDAERQILGLITQTDLLAALARSIPAVA